MEINNVTYAHFSPKGTTRITALTIAQACASTLTEVNLLDQKQANTKRQFEKNELLIVAMPVYSGRIPSICTAVLENLKGSGTPAIAVVTYGNREYDDALLELVNILEAQDFFVVGAAAFIAEHSVFPTVATNRPDAKDKAVMKEFAQKALACVNRISDVPFNRIKVNGNNNYRATSPIPLKPVTKKGCSNCKACSIICPTNAIPIANVKETNHSSCISCGACIKVCHTKARKYSGLVYNMARVQFKKRYDARKEPQMFYIG